MPIDLAKLNPAQQDAVKSIYGPCMIIAGAGSGKTRVLTYKIAHLIDSGISPTEILALTFTNKAANEMKQRITTLLGFDAGKFWMGTFHSIFARLLRFEADKIGFSRNFSIYDTSDSINVMKRVLVEKGYQPDKVNPNGIHGFISKLKNNFIPPEKFSNLAKSPYEKIIDDVYEAYQKELFKSNAMDFDDLLVKPIELFQKDEYVLEKYSTRFRFVLVDEYQDTNRAQYFAIKLLASKHRNISVVGDDAQSIYKWRGAEIKNIFDFESDYPEKKVFRLEQNYRSTKNILSLADDVIKRNVKQINKTLWTSNSEGEKITLFETLTDREEASRAAKYIAERIKSNKINFSDFGVLYRTNAQSRVLEEALIRDNIPYIIVGGTKFYQRKEIKDIIAYLKIIVNPGDSESLLRVLAMREGLGKVSIDRILKFGTENNISYFDSVQNYESVPGLKPNAKNSIKKLLLFIKKYESLRTEMLLDEYVRGIIDEIGIMSDLRMENTNEASDRIENIKELISAVAEFSSMDKNATLEDFLEKISLVTDIDEFDNRKNAVVLMTIHAAKGLEFDTVFITGLEDGLFPLSSSYNNEEDMEEERRLFYVACTRAKVKLFLSYANQRFKFGTQSFQIKSKFLREISDRIIDDKIETEKYVNQKNIKSTASKKPEPKKSGIYIEYDKFAKPKSKEPDKSDDKFNDIKKGVSIFHDTFGSGTVISVVGKGIDKKADILFQDFGFKRIILKYAKMRIEN